MFAVSAADTQLQAGMQNAGTNIMPVARSLKCTQAIQCKLLKCPIAAVSDKNVIQAAIVDCCAA